MKHLLRTALVLAGAGALLLAPQAPVARAVAPHVEPPGPTVVAAPQHPLKPDNTVSNPDQVKRARAAAASGPAPFLTRPYMNHHDVTSVFDHTSPNYTQDGKIVEEDGTTAVRGNGTAPDLSSGYAVTPGGKDYLYYDGHDGWDISLNYEPLLAAAEGTVYFAGWSSVGFGMSVIIDHPNGLSTRYGHMSRLDVQQGQTVYRGQQIGISGNTGNSTGPHLHFGLYRNDPWTPIDPWGWSATFADPWPSDLGDLWISGNPVNPVPASPTNVQASAIGTVAKVTWNQPSFDGAIPVTGFTATASPGGAQVSVSGSSTSATFSSLTPGTTYTFTVTASNQAGTSTPSDPSSPITIGTPAFQAFWPWYDTYTPGMASDNLHLVNPGGTDVSAYVVLGSNASPVTIKAGGESIFSFPGGTMGGPVQILGSGNLVVSQRVEFNQSFNESAGLPPSRAAADLYFSWYDLASNGMLSDNIHLVNPGSATAHVVVSGPGAPITTDVAAGGQTFVSWPQGTIGGPVRVSTSSSTPVMASQRVQYNGTFNEVPARPAGDAATSLVFNWFDHASPGMWNDNIHLVNPGAAPASATVTVGSSSKTVTVPAGGTSYVGFPQGVIGGPVRVSADHAVLASQRVQYYDSFNEVLAVPASAAATSIWMPWYDSASPGMGGDNVHLLNPSPSATAHVTVAGPGPTRTLDVPPGGEAWTSWPNTIGGPVHVTSTGTAVIASQRVQFYGSFNEAVGVPA